MGNELPDFPMSFYVHLINEWIFNERDRAIYTRRLNGATYERLAEEFDMSVRNVKYICDKCRRKINAHIF